MKDDHHLVGVGRTEASRICSAASRSSVFVIEQLDGPEVCLLHDQRARYYSNPKSWKSGRGQFVRIFGSTLSTKAYKSTISPVSGNRKFNRFVQTALGEEMNRCRKWVRSMRAAVANFIQIEREVEMSSRRSARKVLYYA